MADKTDIASVEDMASETDMGRQAVPVWKAWQVRTTGMARKADMTSVVRRYIYVRMLTCGTYVGIYMLTCAPPHDPLNNYFVGTRFCFQWGVKDYKPQCPSEGL